MESVEQNMNEATRHLLNEVRENLWSSSGFSFFRLDYAGSFKWQTDKKKGPNMDIFDASNISQKAKHYIFSKNDQESMSIQPIPVGNCLNGHSKVSSFFFSSSDVGYRQHDFFPSVTLTKLNFKTN